MSTAPERKASVTAPSESSQTAQEYIASQLQLEAEAREALPYAFDTCTNLLGAIRQTLFSCLTCNPPPPKPSDPYTAAGICYSCSISCHGEHELVELFTRRNFVCDCGTTRISSTASCTLRVDPTTGTKGHIRAEHPAATNTYNHNFQNRFCGCGQLYDAHSEKGTMFQCMGLGSVEDGGCGEDWWHPECLMGLSREVSSQAKTGADTKAEDVKAEQPTTELPPVQEEAEDAELPLVDAVASASAEGMADLTEISMGEEAVADVEFDDDPMPPGFPDEDTFEHVLCYKCTRAFPWIKRYAGTPGFLPAVPFNNNDREIKNEEPLPQAEVANLRNAPAPPPEIQPASSVLGKRKVDDDEEATSQDEPQAKKAKAEDTTSISTSIPSAPTTTCLYDSLPQQTFPSPINLFLQSDFRPHLCRCPLHFPLLTPHPQLLEEEDNYEPPLSEASSLHGGAPSTHGSRSLLERGEAALSSMDRVRAIEGVMAYNHVKDKVKDFLKPYAESGQAVGAEEIRAYFERLRGDDEAAREERAAEGK